jgi:hypothetical protein
MYNEPIEYDEYDDRDDRDTGMSYAQQCHSDRCDAVNEKLRRGEIDECQAAEMRMGA